MNLKRNNKKIKRNKKTSHAQRFKERMGEYYEEKPLKIHMKRKKDNYSENLDLINKNKNVTRKKPMKAQTVTVESKKGKTTIKHPRETKNFANKKWQKINQNCCYLENLTLILKKF